MDSLGGNPRPLEFYPIPEKFKGGKTEYDDGGVDTALQHGGAGVKVWRLVYKGLTAAQAALILSHYNTTKWLDDEGMSAFSFNFRERSDVGTTLYSGVRYTKFEYTHTKTWVYSIDVELTKFP